MPILELSGISKRFGHTVALERVDLSLQAGEVLALIGENGAGKSTLMNVISGAVRFDSGSITLEGQRYKPVGQLEARRNGIALIHQELSLAPHLTVAENILLGSEPARFGWINRPELNRRALEILATFHHPEIRPETFVGKLSNAAKQIVEICRAIASNARIILMDEPTSSLQRGDVEAAVPRHSSAQGWRDRDYLYQPLPRGDSRDRRFIYSPA
jgi:ribose transport system ATP-binding protein